MSLMRSKLRVQIGGAVFTSLALALMVFGTVFVAVAGPRHSLQTRTVALRHQLTTLAPQSRAITVTADVQSFQAQVATASGTGAPQPLADSEFGDAGGQLAAGLKSSDLTLAGGAWNGLTTGELKVSGGVDPARVQQVQVKLELVYRDQLPSQSTLAAGSYQAGQAGQAGPGEPLPVATSAATAARFGWSVGSVVTITAGLPEKVRIAAIFRPLRPAAASFWTADPLTTAPAYNPGGPKGPPPWWSGALFPLPGTLAALQTEFRIVPMQIVWTFPITLSAVNADQVSDLIGSLNRVAADTIVLQGSVAGGAPAFNVSDGLLGALTAFAAGDGAVQQVLSLVAVSLTLIGIMLLLLTARVLAVRRYTELAMMRSRGAALWQVTALTLRGSAVAAAPAALGGALAGVLLTPGLQASLAWWLGGVTALIALAGLPAVATWQHRKPAQSSNPARRSRRIPRRLVAEVTACAASAGGLIVLHNQGAPPPGSLNLYIAAAPALVAIPAVLIVGRLYPLAIRALLPLTARGRGPTGFLALARAARTSLASLAPAFALVLALTVASFAGMVQQAVSGGEITASWQSTGADAVVDTSSTELTVTPAAQKVLASVPGVERITPVWDTQWLIPANGNTLNVLIVDPASYAAFTADSPGFPALPAGALSGSAGVLQVLASPGVAAELGSGTATIVSANGMGPLRVHVAGTLTSTPGSPATNVFLIVPLRQFPNQVGPPAWNLALLNGAHIDRTALGAAVLKLFPSQGISLTFRSNALAQLTGSQLQAAAYTLLRISLVVAAGFGFMIVLLGLALGSADREMTLARLTTMGLTRNRLNWLVLLEALPAVIAAAAAAAACAGVLPALIAPALDLSVFTGSGAPVAFVPDLADVGLPAAGLVILAVLAVVAELRLLRGNLAGLLRTGG